MVDWLIVGLGNPGKKYEGTRHNLGFEVLDLMAHEMGLSWEGFKTTALACKGIYEGKTILLAKPLDYMNLSGNAVRQLAQFFKVDVEKVCVVYDDNAFETGDTKLSFDLSAGGHNGVDHIAKLLTRRFYRYRVGIRSDHQGPMALKDYVLQKFTADEKTVLTNESDKFIKELLFLIMHGPEKAMQQINTKKVEQ